MAHEISMVNGVGEAVYAETPAWHNFGTVVEQAPTSQEAMKIAHLDWEVVKLPLLVKADRTEHLENVINVPEKYSIVKNDMEKMSVRDITSHFANVRNDTYDPLGVVGGRYTILQNHEAFDFLDSLVQQEQIKYEAAGALKGGAIVWMLARMKKEFYVTDDDMIKNYMLLVNGHNGLQTALIQPTNVRVVCWNTLQAALDEKTNVFKIRHTKSIKEKVEEARIALNFAYEKTDKLNNILKNLSGKSVSKTDVDIFLEKMFPMNVKDDSPRSEAIKQRIKEHRKRVEIIFDSHPTIKTQAANGTAYGLLNSYTYYLDHDIHYIKKGSISSDEYRFNTSLIGKGAENKVKAVKELVQIMR